MSYSRQNNIGAPKSEINFGALSNCDNELLSIALTINISFSTL